jgi:hypothetical protein
MDKAFFKQRIVVIYQFQAVSDKLLIAHNTLASDVLVDDVVWSRELLQPD